MTTPLGLKAWLVQDKSASAVSLSFSFAGGAASDPKGQSGITNLMATGLTDGAGPLAFQAFHQRQEDAAASLGLAPRSTGSAARCACCRPTVRRVSSCCGSR